MHLRVTEPTSTPVLVVSCDRYADVWAPFFHMFWMHWPDCPFPVYLGSNERTFSSERVRPLAIGPDIDWASNVRAMLDRLNADYVIVLLEDFLIEKPVDSTGIVRLAQLARDHGVGCLRLAAQLPLALPPTHPLPGHDGLGVIEPGEAYRVSAQAAIWRTATLRRLLVPGFSAWDFELLGSQLSERLAEPFWACYTPAIVYDQCVEKGRWKPRGVELCRSAGARIDLDARPVFSVMELQQHYENGRPDSEAYQPKAAARSAFLAGRRWDGMRSAWRYVRRRPFDISVWPILLAGLIGPRASRLANRIHLDRKIRQSTARHERSVREMARA